MDGAENAKDGPMQATDQPPALDAHLRRAVAVEAGCDPRSVVRFERGESLRPTVAMRIERAVARLRRRGELSDAGARGDGGSPSRGHVAAAVMLRSPATALAPLASDSREAT